MNLNKRWYDEEWWFTILLLKKKEYLISKFRKNNIRKNRGRRGYSILI